MFNNVLSCISVFRNTLTEIIFLGLVGYETVLKLQAGQPLPLNEPFWLPFLCCVSLAFGRGQIYFSGMDKYSVLMGNMF